MISVKTGNYVKKKEERKKVEKGEEKRRKGWKNLYQNWKKKDRKIREEKGFWNGRCGAERKWERNENFEKKIVIETGGKKIIKEKAKKFKNIKKTEALKLTRRWSFEMTTEAVSLWSLTIVFLHADATAAATATTAAAAAAAAETTPTVFDAATVFDAFDTDAAALDPSVALCLLWPFLAIIGKGDSSIV